MEHAVSQRLRGTSGLGGKGALCRSSLGSRPHWTNAVTDPKQTNNKPVTKIVTCKLNMTVCDKQFSYYLYNYVHESLDKHIHSLEHLLNKVYNQNIFDVKHSLGIFVHDGLWLVYLLTFLCLLGVIVRSIILRQEFQIVRLALWPWTALLKYLTFLASAVVNCLIM